MEQDGDGVTVTAHDVDSGAEVDGAAPATSSPPTARTASCGTPSASRSRGAGVFSNSITIYFTADLWPQMAGKPLSVIYINNPAFGGFFRLSKDCQSGFLVVNTVGDPSAGATSRCRRRHQRVAGWSNWCGSARACPIWWCASTAWPAGGPRTDVARRYQRRPGLPGRRRRPRDAAQRRVRWQHRHRRTPTTWRGSWRWLCKGVADPALLATYERSVGRSAGSRSSRPTPDTSPAPRPTSGPTDHQPVLPDLEVELGYVYRSSAVSSGDVGDGGDHECCPRRPARVAGPAGQPARRTSGSTAVVGAGRRWT